MPRASAETGGPPVPGDAAVLCFVAGTLIATPRGLRPIELLAPGDLVQTADNGLRRVSWVGRCRTSGLDRLAPIRFVAGAFGNSRDLLVSPQHRMLIPRSTTPHRRNGAETLAAARLLTDGTTIHRAPCASVTYVHLLFDQHEVIFAEGVASESLHPDPAALAALQTRARAEVLALFPDLAASDGTSHPLARPCLPRKTALLLNRHIRARPQGGTDASHLSRA